MSKLRRRSIPVSIRVATPSVSRTNRIDRTDDLTSLERARVRGMPPPSHQPTSIVQLVRVVHGAREARRNGMPRPRPRWLRVVRQFVHLVHATPAYCGCGSGGLQPGWSGFQKSSVTYAVPGRIPSGLSNNCAPNSRRCSFCFAKWNGGSSSMVLQTEIVRCRCDHQTAPNTQSAPWLVVYRDPNTGAYGEIPAATRADALAARDALLREAG